MRGKLMFITGGLVGYVLGARAGRKRYDQIVAAVSELWQAKPIQRRVTEVRDFALDAVGDAPAALFEAGKKAFSAVQAKQARAKAAASAPHPSAARAQAAAKVANAPTSKAAPESKAPESKAAESKAAKAAAKTATKSATTATPAEAASTEAASAAADETTTK